MEDNKDITRRKFLKRTGKLVYLSPAIYTFFADTKEGVAQGQQAAYQQRVERLKAWAQQGNQQAARLLQRLRERLVSPP